MTSLGRRLRDLRREDSGQTLVVVAAALVVLLGFAALSLDVGHAFYAQRQLQATSDSAALAAARAIPTATSTAAINGSSSATGVTLTGYTGREGIAAQFSAVTGATNASGSLRTVTVTTNLLCLQTLQAQGIPCIGAVPYNAVQVQQTSFLSVFFAGILGKNQMALNTVSTASVRGGGPRASNVAVIMDATLSMNQYDANCGNTQMQCALNGLQVLLRNLNPCGSFQTTCSTAGGSIQNPLQSVSLFTFAGVDAATASVDSSCTTPFPAPTAQNGFWYLSNIGTFSMPPAQPWPGAPNALPFSFPDPTASSYAPSGAGTPTYQLTNFLYDYRSTPTSSSLNPNSAIVMAAGGAPGCGGMQPPNYAGVYGTYYAGVIYAAQAALVAQHQLTPSADSILIILSDGDATAPQTNGPYAVMPSPATASGYYPSWVGECGQAVIAAQAASAAGTLVYTVAYGSSPTGCASDAGAGQYPNISPCNTMAGMATAPQMFYSDYMQSGSGSTCYASQPVTSLNQIFQSIANDLSQARLIPNNTT